MCRRNKIGVKNVLTILLTLCCKRNKKKKSHLTFRNVSGTVIVTVNILGDPE